MERWGPPEATVRALAARAGCRVLRVVGLSDGTDAYRLGCEGHEAKVRFLAFLGAWDALQPDVRRYAEAVAAGAPDATEQARALLEHVQRRVVFTREREEIFSPTMRTLAVGAGDCDDSARALLALLRALGLRASLVVLPPPWEGDPSHVAAAVELGGAWHWAETTLAAELGEHPVHALGRLGGYDRTDIHGGGDDLGVLPPLPVVRPRAAAEAWESGGHHHRCYTACSGSDFSGLVSK